jgi:hypothetical protein
VGEAFICPGNRHLSLATEVEATPSVGVGQQTYIRFDPASHHKYPYGGRPALTNTSPIWPETKSPDDCFVPGWIELSC